MTKKRFDFCVLDSAPLLTGNVSSDLSEAFYTVPAVLEEIRDEASRQRLACLPFKLEAKLPSAEALTLVTRFAKATGDISVLSGTDLQVVALTVTLELEQNGANSKVRRVPDELPKMLIHDGPPAVVASSKAKVPAKKQRGPIEVSDFSDTEPVDPVQKLADELDEKASLSGEDESEGEWITPENVKSFSGEGKKKKKSKKKNAAKNPVDDSVTEAATSITAQPTNTKTVACLTSDFAMQNVLLRMKCKLYTVDGIRVKSLKNWLLRCHACFAITQKMDTRFCPKCGGPTLNRVSFLLDESGKIHLFLRSDYQYNLRGSKYSIAMPKGGRQGAQLILRDDQKEHIKQREHYERIQNKLIRKEAVDFEEALDDRIAAVFGAAGSMGAGKNRRYDQYDGMTPPVIGFGRKNPNISRKKV